MFWNGRHNTGWQEFLFEMDFHWWCPDIHTDNTYTLQWRWKSVNACESVYTRTQQEDVLFKRWGMRGNRQENHFLDTTLPHSCFSSGILFIVSASSRLYDFRRDYIAWKNALSMRTAEQEETRMVSKRRSLMAFLVSWLLLTCLDSHKMYSLLFFLTSILRRGFLL